VIPEIISLCGFMGSGKSAVGARLAAALEYPFIDLDMEIARQEGEAVDRIFARRGEGYFRARERELGLESLQYDCGVIALGGGALQDDELRAAVRSRSYLIYLKADPRTLYERTQQSAGRPLLLGIDSYEEFLEVHERYMAERRPAYELADLTIAVDTQPVAKVVAQIVSKLKAEPDTRTISVAVASQAYPVYVDDGILARLGAFCTDSGLSPRATLVTSEPLWHLYGEKAQASLHNYGFEVRRILIPDGEQAKNLSEVALIYQALADARHERGDPVIALGGGTVGDVAGFAAATYLRGVPVVQVPTTLLAQVDSAIGGKTGVNLKHGKNLVGAFWQPRLVVCDTHLCASLPRRQVASGLAEVVKYGCISRPALLEMVGERLTQLLNEPVRVDPDMVALSVAAKAEVVAADEREADRRRMLNFGHTFGHALEATLGYEKLLHGEAVALGMLVALELSLKYTGLAEPTAERVTALLRQIFKGLDFPDVPFVRVTETMARDKKVQAGRAIWVLLRALGDPVLHYVSDAGAVEQAVAAAQTRWKRR